MPLRRAARGALLLALAGGMAVPAAGQDWTERLPEGAGKETVAAVCAGCHEFFSRAGNGYTPDGWHTVLRMMVNFGAPILPEQIETLTAYLIRNFPEKPKPPGRMIAGRTRISIQTWTVPTPGSRPHDPLATRDGALWYTGQMVNVLGRLDPRTGMFTIFPLQTPHGAPHGLAEDPLGNIWYTANAGGFIGKLNPKFGLVTEYPLPDSNAKDPHTLVFDRSGILWFTVQNANKLGRMNPQSGRIEIFESPTPGSRPYGIQVNSRGIPFYVEFGAPKVASIDPFSLEIREYSLPDPGARPRRLAITSDDAVWYTDYARGFLGRLDPATGKVTEWASPAGPKSQPYGISAIRDVLWYSESGTAPNTIVRFDPKRRKFQSWPLPKGGNIVRNTAVTPEGNLVLANSLVNAVTLVLIEEDRSGTRR